MNEKSLLAAIKTKLQTISYFNDNSVIISAGTPFNAIDKLPFPIAIIKPKSGAMDQETGGEAPQFQTYEFSVFIVVRIANDAFGTAPLMGTSVQTGLLDIAAAMQAVLAELGPSSGIVVQSTAWSQSEPIVVDPNSYVLFREYNYRTYINL